MTEETVLLIAGGFLVAGAAIGAGVLYKKRRGGKTHAEVIPVKLETGSEKPCTAPKEASFELAENAEKLIGLYESLWMIKSGQLKPDSSIFSEWDIRIDGMEEAPALAAFWSGAFSGFEYWDEPQIIQKCGELLAFIESADIIRSSETEIVADRDAFRRYFKKEGFQLEPGSPARVEQPCWYIEDRVLEKGVISFGQDSKLSFIKKVGRKYVKL